MRARAEAFAYKAMGKPVRSQAVLQGFSVVLGYSALIKAVDAALALLIDLKDLALPRESAHSFVLTALDVIPRTATMVTSLKSEMTLVAVMETHMNPQNFEPTFCAAALRKWRSSAVADVLRARGVLQTGVAAHQETLAAFEARQRADIEKTGLRECAWPSCDKVERTVREFKQCSGCRSVWPLQPGASHARLGGAQKGLPKARQSAAGGDGCRRRGIGRCSMNWMRDARFLSIPCGELRAASLKHGHIIVIVCVCDALRLTSHGVPRVCGAAARPLTGRHAAETTRRRARRWRRWLRASRPKQLPPRKPTAQPAPPRTEAVAHVSCCARRLFTWLNIKQFKHILPACQILN